MNDVENIKAILVRPGEQGKLIEFPHTLSEMQNLVEGTIEAVYPFEDKVCIICNDDGKFIETALLNRTLRDEDGRIYDILCGNFLVVGIGNGNFCSLSDKYIEKYLSYYQDPEVFNLSETGGVTVFKRSQFPTFEAFENYFYVMLISGVLQKAKEVLV